MNGKAIELAKYFANMCIKEGYEVTSVKLQKLLYFAQGLYIVHYNNSKDKIKEKLFDEKIFLWVCGPMIKEVNDYFVGESFEEPFDIIYWIPLNKEKKIMNRVFTEYGNKASVEITIFTKSQLREELTDEKKIYDEILLEELYSIFEKYKVPENELL